jgi:hypothetical protein
MSPEMQQSRYSDCDVETALFADYQDAQERELCESESLKHTASHGQDQHVECSYAFLVYAIRLKQQNQVGVRHGRGRGHVEGLAIADWRRST